ncbi:MAG: hypothetical protein KAI40_07200 [Desulfobacterales bacterium]|nr:hypothetical protein [Desulfobacterales bacterium]
MASITEILTLVVIIIGIIILPKMFRQEKKGSSKEKLSINSIPVLVRFGILASILIPIISALFFQPWKNNLTLFILTGIIPLIVGWGMYWMIAGLKNKTKTR